MPLGTGDPAALEDERCSGRADRIHRRLDDRLEGLFEVERLGDSLGDPCERLELPDATLRLGVELRMDDRLCDLRRDGEQELDLRVRELARAERAHVERARELLPRKDGDWEERRVLVLV